MSAGLAAEAPGMAEGPAELDDLPFVNIMLNASPSGGKALYAPDTGDSADHRLVEVPDEYESDVESLRSALGKRLGTTGSGSRFNLNVGSLRMRATVLRAEGEEAWVVLRRIPPKVPALTALNIHPGAVAGLRRWLTRPGLSMVCGTFEAGKTTTGCAMLQDQVVTYGGLAISMESPTEFYMHGRMGDYGHCIQIPVDETSADAWERLAADVRKASPNIIYVGEVSTPTIARIVVALSTTGRPVLTTCHGSGHADAIRTLVSFAEEAGISQARNTLSGSMVGVAHQTMVNGKPVVRLLSLDRESDEDTRTAISNDDSEAIDDAASVQEAEAMEAAGGAGDIRAMRGGAR